jgi:2-polyprenyl-3-methyl-5-hydroxy-6-metoxy-1,4-benzoquinol methylase
MKNAQLDPATINLATYNDPDTVAFATADAEDYMPHIFAHPIFTDFNASLPGKQILDLGCGPGLMSKYYSDHGYEVTGLDFSANMIAAAAKQCPACHFLTKNVLDLDSTDGKFDGIVSLHLIQFLERDQIIEMFRKVSAALNNDGRFMLVFTNTCFPKTGCNVNSSGKTEYWTRWALEDIAPLFVKGGLELVKFEQPKLANGEEPFFFIAKKAA